MNKNQKIILAIFIPIIIFFIALTIAYYTGVTTHTTTASEKVTLYPVNDILLLFCQQQLIFILTTLLIGKNLVCVVCFFNYRLYF